MFEISPSIWIITLTLITLINLVSASPNFIIPLLSANQNESIVGKNKRTSSTADWITLGKIYSIIPESVILVFNKLVSNITLWISAIFSLAGIDKFQSFSKK